MSLITPAAVSGFHFDLIRQIEQADLTVRSGRVTQFLGTLVVGDGPDAFWGERCDIISPLRDEPITAEVVGIKDGKVLLMPYGYPHGISLGSKIIAKKRFSEVPVGNELLGRVIDALGKPLDEGPPIDAAEYRSIYSEPLNALQRPPIDSVLETGVRSIDTLLTIGRGQRVGIFAGSGVGKSTLLGMICRNMNADINVIALIGERGREVAEFIHHVLGPEGLARSVVVVATSDQSALERSHAALAATAIAEYFRDQGKDVVLTMDSITRFATAQRELGLAVGEPPTTRGFTPSVFAMLPRLMERCGNSPRGSITAFYTVLVEADDMNDPIADHARSILDGAIVLSRKLAGMRHFPPIDITQSNSRLINVIASRRELEQANNLARMIAIYENARDMIDMGAYRKGTNVELDGLIQKLPAINRFLQQGIAEPVARQDALTALAALVTTNG